MTCRQGPARRRRWTRCTGSQRATSFLRRVACGRVPRVLCRDDGQDAGDPAGGGADAGPGGADRGTGRPRAAPRSALIRRGGAAPRGAAGRHAAGRRVRSPQPAWHIAVLGSLLPTPSPWGAATSTRHAACSRTSRAKPARRRSRHEMAHVLLGDATAHHLAGLAPVPLTSVSSGWSRVCSALAFDGGAVRAVRQPRRRTRAGCERARRQGAGGSGVRPASLNVVLETLDRLNLDTDELEVPTWGMTHGRGIRIHLSSLPSAPAADPEGRARPAAEPNGKAKPAADASVQRSRGRAVRRRPAHRPVRVLTSSPCRICGSP